MACSPAAVLAGIAAAGWLTSAALFLIPGAADPGAVAELENKATQRVGQALAQVSKQAAAEREARLRFEAALKAEKNTPQPRLRRARVSSRRSTRPRKRPLPNRRGHGALKTRSRKLQKRPARNGKRRRASSRRSPRKGTKPKPNEIPSSGWRRSLPSSPKSPRQRSKRGKWPSGPSPRPRATQSVNASPKRRSNGSYRKRSCNWRAASASCNPCSRRCKPRASPKKRPSARPRMP